MNLQEAVSKMAKTIEVLSHQLRGIGGNKVTPNLISSIKVMFNGSNHHYPKEVCSVQSVVRYAHSFPHRANFPLESRGFTPSQINTTTKVKTLRNYGKAEFAGISITGSMLFINKKPLPILNKRTDRG